MAVPNDKSAVQAAAEAAKNFIENYYKTLNDRNPVANYYVTGNATYRTAGHPPADICINGLVTATPEEWDAILAKQRQKQEPLATTTNSSSSINSSKSHPVHYEVDTSDTHIINRDYRFAAPPALLVPDPSKPDRGAGMRIMLMLTVSGTVYFTSDKEDGSKQHFNDVFILVPHWDALARRGSRGVRKTHLIASHNYRAF